MFFRCSSSIALHPSALEGPVAPVALELPGMSHVKLPLTRCRATRGVWQLHLRVSRLHCAIKPRKPNEATRCGDFQSPSAPHPMPDNGEGKLKKRAELGQGYYQTYAAYQGCAQVSFSTLIRSKHRKIAENGEKCHHFFSLRESQVALNSSDIPAGQNTVSRVLSRKRELAKLGECCEKTRSVRSGTQVPGQKQTH